MRKLHTDQTGQPDLPDKVELGAIIQSEAARPVAHGKETIHYPRFDTIVKLIDYYGLSAKLFQPSTDTIDQIVTAGSQLVAKLTQVIVDDHGGSALPLLLAAYDYLAEEDEPEKADLIFVFGANSNHRIEKAIELFKGGYAPKLFITGGRPFYVKANKSSEAERYQDLALNAGIPASAIVLETQAMTIADNVRRSLNLLDKKKLKFDSLICVLSPYVQRRGYTTLQKYLPDSVKIYRVNSSTNHEYQRDEWYKHEMAIKVVLNEFIKMRASVAFNSS